jgi:hypothetical protein
LARLPRAGKKEPYRGHNILQNIYSQLEEEKHCLPAETAVDAMGESRVPEQGGGEARQEAQDTHGG